MEQKQSRQVTRRALVALRGALMAPQLIAPSERQRVGKLEAKHRKHTGIVEWNHVVALPNGKVRRVNRFDYNLAVCAGALDRYIQLDDTSWIKVRNLVRL